MALRGLKVVEMAGLAPAPFAGMILAGRMVQIICLGMPLCSINYFETEIICDQALLCFTDFGASVVRVDKPNQPPLDTLARYGNYMYIDVVYNYGLCQSPHPTPS